MNSFDSSIIHFLNGFARHSVFFDTFVSMLSQNDLLKGGVIVALIWCAWFRPSVRRDDSRNYLLCGIIACLLSVVAARTLAHSLPYRERPMREPILHFQIPYGTDQEDLINWSAFPSDHATAFFALATCVVFVWRAAGIFAFFYVFTMICLPRLFLGFHHPTDVIAGAVLGITVTWLCCLPVVRGAVARTTEPWLEKSPGTFYACLFLITFQIATIFESTRDISHYFIKFLRHT